MIKIEILTNKQDWESVINLFDSSDFYHTYEYHNISKNENETPVIIKYSEGDVLIALPLLIRNIENSKYKDATSVYGYAGPLSNKVGGNFDNANFINNLQSLFVENRIISVFSRLNPFIPFQESVLDGIGSVNFHGQIVNIDITEALEIQRAKYNRRLKSYVNKARKQCTVKKASSDAEILAYIDVYYENMNRVNATKGYYFDKEYFYKLIDAKDFEKDILIALDNESQEIIAGAMFVKKNNIVQYHLSGVKEAFLHLNPIKLLIDEMRLLATEEEYSYFNLGGGLGAQEDSLFRFKSLFSKDFKDFKLWKYIVDQEAYKELVDENIEANHREEEHQDSNFFPAYRA